VSEKPSIDEFGGGPGLLGPPHAPRSREEGTRGALIAFVSTVVFLGVVLWVVLSSDAWPAGRRTRGDHGQIRDMVHEDLQAQADVGNSLRLIYGEEIVSLREGQNGLEIQFGKQGLNPDIIPRQQLGFPPEPIEKTGKQGRLSDLTGAVENKDLIGLEIIFKRIVGTWNKHENFLQSFKKNVKYVDILSIK